MNGCRNLVSECFPDMVKVLMRFTSEIEKSSVYETSFLEIK